MYSPVSGSSRCEPARWQRPSRSAASPRASPRSTRPARSASRARAAPTRPGRAPGRASRWPRSCARSRRRRAAAARRPHRRHGVPRAPRAPPPGRRHADRGEHSGAAGQRGGHVPFPNPAEAHPHPVVRAHRGGQLAGERGPGARQVGRRRALQPREQRGGEDVEGERGRDGIAGRPQDRGGGARVGASGAEHHRVAGLDRHAVHGEHAHLLDHRRGVVVAARARAGDNDHEVGAAGRRAHGVHDPLLLVRHDRVTHHVAAGVLGLGGEHERVGVGELARAELGPDRPNLVPCRDHRHHRAAAHREPRRSRGSRGRHVNRPQTVAGREQQLGRAHVLADRAHVLVGNGRRAQLHLAPIALVHVLAHHHGVAAVRHWIAGVHDLIGRRAELHGRGLARLAGVFGAYGDPVHRGGVEGRRGARCPDRLGGDPAHGPLERHFDRLEAFGAARLGAGIDPGGQRLGGRDVVDEGSRTTHESPTDRA